MSLAHAIHRITLDEDFAAQFRVDSESALSQAGFTLEAGVRQALVRVLQDPARVHKLLSDLEAGLDGPDWALMNTVICANQHAS